MRPPGAPLVLSIIARPCVAKNSSERLPQEKRPALRIHRRANLSPPRATLNRTVQARSVSDGSVAPVAHAPGSDQAAGSHCGGRGISGKKRLDTIDPLRTSAMTTATTPRVAGRHLIGGQWQSPTGST